MATATLLHTSSGFPGTPQSAIVHAVLEFMWGMLDEMNYSGSDELVRIFPLQQAQFTGALKQIGALAEQCMADYDEDGWKHSAYRDASDISVVGKG